MKTAIARKSIRTPQREFEPIIFNRVSDKDDYVALWSLAQSSQYDIDIYLTKRPTALISVVPATAEPLPFEQTGPQKGVTRNRELCNSSATQLWRIENGHFMKPGVRPTPGQRDQFIADHPVLMEGVEFSARNRWPKMLDPTVVASAHVLIGKGNGPDITGDFLQRVTKGVNLNEDSPIQRFRDQMLRRKRNASHLVEHDRVLALLIKVFNLDSEGRQIQRLRPPTDPGLPEINSVLT